MKPTNVGIIGWGTVGNGTAKILLEQAALIEKRLGRPIVLKKLADLDLTTPRGISPSPDVLTTDANEIFNDPEIDIVVELIGGYEPAKTFTLKAIAAGKHVVTANKALLATHGREIFQAAAEAGVEVLYEASVGGGIPIIRSMKEGLAANNIEKFFGILNGTSNYILTKMTDEGMDFGQALKEAQEQGFAEADPTFDVEGIDAAHKLVILTALAYGFFVNMDDVYIEGISRLDPLDIQFAREFGYELKLLAVSSRQGDQIEARLHPAMVPIGHLLTEVKGPFNAVHVTGDAVDDVMFYGRGAGMMPTASAVVGDIMELSRNINSGAVNRVPALAWPDPFNSQFSLKPMEEVTTPYYFRFSVVDQPGVLSKISGILGDHGISIGAVIQKGREIDGSVPIVMLTHEAKESDVQAALSRIDLLEVVRDKTVLVRVEDRLG